MQLNYLLMANGKSFVLMIISHVNMEIDLSMLSLMGDKFG